MRTPYNAALAEARMPRPSDRFLQAGYIRGKHDSEGEYVVTRPVRGAFNDSGVDHSTDAWDTIDWSRGRCSSA